jgi:hypothetical protein
MVNPDPEAALMLKLQEQVKWSHKNEVDNKIQCVPNTRKLCIARPTGNLAEVRAKLCPELLLKYPPLFCGLNTSVQVAKETGR